MTYRATRPSTCVAAQLSGRIPATVPSTSICRAGTCQTCSSRAPPPFLRIQAITRLAPSRRSLIGVPRRSAPNISRTRGRSSMRRPYAVIATASLGVAALTSAQAIDIQDFDLIQRGRYLTDVGDCGACHTLPDSSRLLAGGRPIETPFGTLLARNITPDPETGIGARTDDEVVNSLTKGTGRNGIHLYPAMPYTYSTKITRDDALAIRAYLNTIPAVRNPVVPNQLRFPFDVRAGLIAWDALNFRPGEFKPVAGKSTAW